ncbi:delta endotoxin C-terminal domain-containing protein, partial [Bacillus wiedmannii]|uniref:delta endotoxin C-terminal domain-containing protein n=1 Tax=Bacillus wiedmannii TaxID=1890302 RepID=UPI003D1D5E4C
SQNSLSAIEERMIPKPSLFKWLTQLHFYSRQLGNADNWTAGQIVTALQTMIRKTLGNEEVLPFVGTIGTAVKTLYPGDFGGITWIDTLQWFEPRWLKFWSGNDNTGWTYQGELGTIVEKNPFWAAGPLTRIYYPSERANYIPEHRLSWVTYEPIRSNSPYGWTEYTQLGALALGWTHESVDPKNTMEVDKITRIPAVKAYDIGASGPGQVIKGPGSTGGDLVSLSYNTSMKVRLTTPYTTQKKTYRVRIRYASTGNTQMYVKRESTTTSPIAQTFNVPQTYSGGALTYQTFKYFDTITISTSSGITPNDLAFEITIQNQSNTTLIIDQIEFIPLSSGSGATPAGTYQLVSALNNSSVVTLNLTNNNVELWQNNDDSNQKWRFEYNKSLDSFILRNVANQNLILSWVWTGANFYYNVNVVPSNPDDVYSWPKNWIPIDAGGGYNRLRAYGGGWDGAITVENGETKNGTNIHYDTYSGKTSQKFRLVKLS